MQNIYGPRLILNRMSVGMPWARHFLYGVCDPVKHADPALYRSDREAMANAEIAVLCVMFHNVEQALQDCGDLSGKVLIDTTNPQAPDEGGLKLSMGFNTSAAEFIAARTSARVVKALNQVGASVLGNTSGYSDRPIQFIAGDDAEAKQDLKVG
jgi:predicted dinucleotide-binding enzyme